MHIRKNMIAANEGFKCGNCRRFVEPAQKGICRNHCPYCLYSLHVDDQVPGDRASQCRSLMVPVSIENHKKKGTRILHMCKACAHRGFNRIAPDDDWELICKLSRVPIDHS